MATVDRWGRRPLLLWGVTGITISLFVLAAASAGPQAGSGSSAATWANLTALLFYVGCYQARAVLARRGGR